MLAWRASYPSEYISPICNPLLAACLPIAPVHDGKHDHVKPPFKFTIVPEGPILYPAAIMVTGLRAMLTKVVGGISLCPRWFRGKEITASRLGTSLHREISRQRHTICRLGCIERSRRSGGERGCAGRGSHSEGREAMSKSNSYEHLHLASCRRFTRLDFCEKNECPFSLASKRPQGPKR